MDNSQKTYQKISPKSSEIKAEYGLWNPLRQSI